MSTALHVLRRHQLAVAPEPGDRWLARRTPGIPSLQLRGVLPTSPRTVSCSSSKEPRVWGPLDAAVWREVHSRRFRRAPGCLSCTLICRVAWGRRCDEPPFAHPSNSSACKGCPPTFHAVCSTHLVPNKEPNWCYCRCWSGSKAPSRRVHTSPALPCAGAGVQVTGYLEARLGEGSVSIPLAFP